ncbi:DUF421 domain-containing protein [Stenotrophomonas maltophilia]|uniref:YetF domain-containing protein n=1 Tax=Stenotrophomonas maltophilia TaxID=40324 RepID=UPI0015E040ED|nr:YetF domain-containing protein [Stenotrophomonas maltophilia]MBA0388922.1 DUF421 domain-containing protein [Stenotrophomonas maltophilia]MBA0392768.1 DUF421 domain-containing protein [Stenotrophomonas maltophilia]MBA0465771.1 DUF421 domain-containing protein [Stenotrophomonas maltophilia]MBA0473652.1 DUF421 domain-containing protein [Stenotrophomonas maltophilia]
MPDLFALDMPWWEFILRAVVVYVVVLGMVRLGGKRALGQITPFDVLLRRELISRADFDAALRQQGGLQIEDVQIALLETTGHITIIPRKSA